MNTSTINTALICFFTLMITLTICGTVTKVKTIEAATCEAAKEEGK